MVFSSATFFFFFLPACLLGYFAIGHRFRNTWLLVCSVVFYTWGGGAFVLILFTSIILNYAFGRLVERGKVELNQGLVRWGLVGSVATNLGLLGYFKYANFVVDQINALGASIGLGQIAWTSIALPIGISFFTFQSMSYTIDVARDRAAPLRSLVDFALYVALFPQLIAGPIVRFHELADQLHSRAVTIEGFADGVTRFVHGLAKKVLIADAVAPIADAAFNAPTGDLAALTAWMGLAAYTLQIYFDFSGYSDMAIGLGLMFGFRFPENFRRPYSSLSITDFWRRWHITLSNWFRDYLYIPLGGSRTSHRRTLVNLWVVFLLTGFWHGANWTFLVWGAYHGSLLVAERTWGLRAIDDDTKFKPLRRFMTLFLVMIGWVIFRAPSLTAALGYYGALFSAGGVTTAAMSAGLTNRSMLVLVVAGIGVILLPRDFVGGVALTSGDKRWILIRVATLLIALPLAAITIASDNFSPFLYFQF